MCNCKEKVAIDAILCDQMKGRSTVHSKIVRYGYSIVRIRPYRISDGQPSETYVYPSVDWKYCPFCGDPTSRK